MVDETLVGLMHVNPKQHLLLTKRIGTTLLDHVSGALNIIPVVKLAHFDTLRPAI